jgi:hypothetical protein
LSLDKFDVIDTILYTSTVSFRIRDNLGVFQGKRLTRKPLPQHDERFPCQNHRIMTVAGNKEAGEAGETPISSTQAV